VQEKKECNAVKQTRTQKKKPISKEFWNRMKWVDQMEDNPRLAEPEVLLAWLCPGVSCCFIWAVCCLLCQPSAYELQLCANNE
jgi:hypothetical protein